MSKSWNSYSHTNEKILIDNAYKKNERDLHKY